MTFFLLTNPIGNTPAILAILKKIPIERQRIILLRETFFCFLLATAFLIVGEYFLDLLAIKDYTVSFSGGILLFLVAIAMMFPHHAIDNAEASDKEPLLVPIATPLLGGGALFTGMMIYAHQENNDFKVFGALVISFIAVAAVLWSAPSLNKRLGDKGMLALEQLMGMILCMLSVEMMIKGCYSFIQSLN